MTIWNVIKTLKVDEHETETRRRFRLLCGHRNGYAGPPSGAPEVV